MKAFARIVALLLLAALLPLCALAEEPTVEAEELPRFPEFSLTDQYGRVWTNEDLAGKRVFLNIWTTWCPYCIQEMPDIEKLYQDTGLNEGDTVILGLDPLTMDNTDAAGVIAFLQEQGVTYPVLIDTDGALFSQLDVEGYPTTYFILPDGTVPGYMPGMMTYNTMVQLLDLIVAQ